MRTGSFHCFSCGASGGDLVAFVMLRDGCAFPEACKTLGCWDNHARPVKLSRQKGPVVGRVLLMNLVIDGEMYQVRTEIFEGDFLATLRRCYHFADDRLTEIHAGGAEEYEGETEVLWQILADSHELIREEENRALEVGRE